MMKRFPNLRGYLGGGGGGGNHMMHTFCHIWNVNSNSKSSKNTEQSVQRLTESLQISRGIYALLGKGHCKSISCSLQCKASFQCIKEDFLEVTSEMILKGLVRRIAGRGRAQSQLYRKTSRSRWKAVVCIEIHVVQVLLLHKPNQKLLGSLGEVGALKLWALLDKKRVIESCQRKAN